jgi:Ca-activated chloride channel family protein
MMKKQILFIALFVLSFAFSQTEAEIALAKENQALLSRAQKNIEKGDFASAEAKYRKVIATDPKNTEAKYNLGNVYYQMGKNTEAQRRYIQAAETAQTKTEKHKIYHNLGNVFMNQKQYRPAVEAYKNALRNDPTDDETRYNLALAKKMLEEHGDDGGGEDDQEEEQDDEKEEGDSQEEQNQGNEDKDGQDKGEDGEADSDESEENDEGEPQEGEEEGAPQPKEGRLSPQQIQSLLDAMNNEERKVQEKVNAEKQKGARTSPEKDW